MSTILNTNAAALSDEHGAMIGYAVPASDPVSIDTKWITKWGREDELVYVVKWADGTYAECFSLSNGWHDIYLRCVRARQEAGLAKLDAALARAAEPLSAPIVAGAVNLLDARAA